MAAGAAHAALNQAAFPLSPLALALALALFLAGCAAPHPSGQPPPTALPTTWQRAPATAVTEATAETAETATPNVTPDWWTSFGSSELGALVQRAQAQSLDVAAAIARVEQAEATARIAGAALWPSLTASLDASRVNGRVTATSVRGPTYGAGIAARYEVDLWGGLRATHASALALLAASRFDRDTIRLTITAGVATTWLQAVGLHERADLAQQNLEAAERLLALVEARVRAGAASPLELAQQRGLAAAQRRVRAAWQQQAAAAEVALSLLLGAPGDLLVSTRSLDAVQVPTARAGMPAQLLLRRPDVARAEAMLAAADASVEAARAAIWPTLSLQADLATGGVRPWRVLSDPVSTLTAGLLGTIFDGGRRVAGRDLAQAQRQELVVNYRQAVMAALADVESALDSAGRLDEQMAAQAVALEEAQRALYLAERRYRAGAETLLTLLDAQRTLHSAQDESAALKAQRLQASVGLYRGLGGGWLATETVIR